jgi:hypothetical protein
MRCTKRGPARRASHPHAILRDHSNRRRQPVPGAAIPLPCAQGSLVYRVAQIRCGPDPSPSSVSQPLPSATQVSLLDDTLNLHLSIEKQLLRCESVMQNYAIVSTEFGTMLLQFFATAAEGWHRCRPDHVLYYFYHVLPLHHQGRDGGPLAATTVRGLMSALSQNFKARGRDRQ